MQGYVMAKPERIWSKLAVETVLRSHVLASVASGFTRSEGALLKFFDKTFYSYQSGSLLIHSMVMNVLSFLYREKMIRYDRDSIEATDFGRRTSELYIDPLSAVVLRDGMYRRPSMLTDLSLLHLVCHTPDTYPKAYPRRREIDELGVFAALHYDEYMFPYPDEADKIEYEAFLGEIKLAQILTAWIDEVTEDEILRKFAFQPGDLFRLINSTDWLLYASLELGKLFAHKDLLSKLSILKDRVKRGVRKEILSLVKLEGIGRVRGRMLFNSGLKSLVDLRRAPIEQLIDIPLIGYQVARSIKYQVGGVIKDEAGKRLDEKGKINEQKTLPDYGPR
jgi:helicase